MDGWPLIGSGKTLAAFLSAIHKRAGLGTALSAETRLLYISPRKAPGNDILTPGGRVPLRSSVRVPLA